MTPMTKINVGLFTHDEDTFDIYITKIPRLREDEVMVWTLGSDKRPVTSEEIQKFAQLLSSHPQNRNCNLNIVVPYDYDFKAVGREKFFESETLKD